MVNTKDAQDKRAKEYLEYGYELVRPGVQLEPYVTWDQLIMAVMTTQLLQDIENQEANENSLQLSEDPSILKGRKVKK